MCCTSCIVWSHPFRAVLIRVHVDARYMLLVLLVLSTGGLLLLGDWQTLGSVDQCNNFSVETDNSHSYNPGTQCSSQPCALFEIDLGQVCEDPLQSDSRLSQLAYSQFNVSLYPVVIADGLAQWPNVSFVSSCPPCSDSDGTGLCMHTSVENGQICATELTHSPNSPGTSSFSTDLLDYQTRVCITIGQDIPTTTISGPCPSLPVILMEGIVSLPFTSTLQSQQQCEDHSASPHYCYWNQDSLVTGKHCPNCSPLCRSTRKIPHFAQVFLSIALLTVAAGGGVWVIGALLVRVTPPSSLVSDVCDHACMSCMHVHLITYPIKQGTIIV